MRRFLCGVSFALLVVSLSAPAQAACQLHELGELPVKIVGSQVIVDAKFNGQLATMLVDTGAVRTLLTREGAKRLNLGVTPLPDAVFYGVGGSDTAGMALIKEFIIGDMTSRDLHVYVTGVHDMGAVGLLGADYLLQADVEFDFPDNKIRFFKPEDCKDDQVVYWGKAYAVAPMIEDTRLKILINVLLNGVRVNALMDSGATFSTVTTTVAQKAGVTENSPGAVDAGRETGMGRRREQAFDATFQTFSFGDETIKNAKLEFADMFGANKEIPIGSRIATPAVEQPEMLLGTDFFRSHRIYVARSQRKVYASYMGGPVFDLPERRPEPETPTPSAPPASPQPK